MSLQLTMFAPKSEWVPPHELPDLSNCKQIAIDVETRDPNIKTKGPGWPTGDGMIVGYAIATENWAHYIPIKHVSGQFPQRSDSIEHEHHSYWTH